MGGEPQILHRSGRAGVWLLLAVGVVAALIWGLMRGPATGTQAEGLNPEFGNQSQAGSGATLGDLGSQGTAATRNAGGSSRGAAPQFLGTGSIRGLVTTSDGTPPPKPFIVHVGPSNSLGGREYAQLTSAEFSEDEFELPDLPLGGYDVWIEAPGMNTQRSPVLLTQTAQDPYIVLRISPMGFLDGFVMNEDGRPGQDVRVELAAMFGEERQVTVTRHDGFYAFKLVPDGEYKLLIGPQHQPLVPVRELKFTAPKMHFPKVILPPTVDILVHSTDGKGKPLQDVTISGFGDPSGRLEITTDAQGDGWARNLPPGRYRVIGEHADGLRAKMTFIVKDEQGQEFNIAVR